MHSKVVLFMTQGMLPRCKDINVSRVLKDLKITKTKHRDRRIGQGDTS